MLISFSTNVLNFIWHGLNYPDSLPARQSFLYVFLVLTMAYDAYRHLEETDARQILCGYLTAVGFLMFCEKPVVQIHNIRIQRGRKYAGRGVARQCRIIFGLTGKLLHPVKWVLWRWQWCLQSAASTPGIPASAPLTVKPI